MGLIQAHPGRDEASEGERWGRAGAKPTGKHPAFAGERRIPPGWPIGRSEGLRERQWGGQQAGTMGKEQRGGYRPRGYRPDFNSVSKKEVQGVTGGVDTSGITNQSVQGEREAKTRQPGHSPGQEEEGNILAGAGPEPGIASAAPRTGAGSRRCPGDILSLCPAQEQVICSRTRVALGER